MSNHTPATVYSSLFICGKTIWQPKSLYTKALYAMKITMSIIYVPSFNFSMHVIAQWDLQPSAVATSSVLPAGDFSIIFKMTLTYGPN